MFLSIVRNSEKASRSKKKSAKNARHKANRNERKKREQEAMTRKKEQELEKIKENKKQDFIKFITSTTLYEDDDDWYHGEPLNKYIMPSAYEIAIKLGTYFDWVIMEYDNFRMPDPTILNETRRHTTSRKDYWYNICELPNMDYILNVALRHGCNTMIIERLLQKGSSPNKTPFDYRSINQKLIMQHEKHELHQKLLSTICHDYDDYDDDYDDYDDDYNPPNNDLFLDAHSEYQLMPPICIAAVSGMWSVVKLLLEYKANIQEHVLELEYRRKTTTSCGLNQFIDTTYTALDYAMRSFNPICINIIKGEYQKIQPDKQSLMQCLAGKRNVNCIHIPGIYRHINSFLGQSNIKTKKYTESRLKLDWDNFPIYSKSGLHIYYEKQDSIVLRFTHVPIFEVLRNKYYKVCGSQYNNFYNGDAMVVLPHTSVNRDYMYIGSIELNIYDMFNKPQIYMKSSLDFIGFGNCDRGYNFHEQKSEYIHYDKYVDVKITDEHIIISCTFDGGIERMAEYYLTKYRQVINSDIFGTYIRNHGSR